MVLYSASYGLQILRRWDIRSGSEGQLVLERKTYLISTLLTYVFSLEIISLFFFIFTVDQLHTFFVGAMCAAGTLYVNSYGYPVLILKVINFLLAGLWLIVNYADNRGYDYPLIKKKYLFLLILTPLIVAETVLQANYFLRLDPNIITSCCGSLFSIGEKSLTSEISAFPIFPMKILFYLSLALTVASGLFFLLRIKGGYLLACFSGLDLYSLYFLDPFFYLGLCLRTSHPSLPLLYFAEGILLYRISPLPDAFRRNPIRNWGRPAHAFQKYYQPVRDSPFHSKKVCRCFIDFFYYFCGPGYLLPVVFKSSYPIGHPASAEKPFDDHGKYLSSGFPDKDSDSLKWIAKATEEMFIDIYRIVFLNRI